MACCSRPRAADPLRHRRVEQQQREPWRDQMDESNLRKADIASLQHKIDEMKGLRTAEVRSLAVLAGAVEAQLDAADEAPDTRAALIDWIIAKEIAMARVQPPTVHGAGLRMKLATLRVSELKREALALGVEQSHLDSADDSESPKEAFIELVVAKEMESFAGAQTMQARVEVLRAELLALRVSELKQRALGAGTAQSEIDEADDIEGGPKAALVECIIRMGMTASEEDGGAAEAAERARVEKLRGELLVLRVSELKRRALGAGVAQSEIDEADDNEGGPTAALVDLILSKPCHVGAAKACHAMAQLEERRAGLRELRLSELRRRAIAAGVDSAGMDAADDSAEPKAELIELLISAPPATQVPATHGQSRSHFGDRKSSDGKRPSGQQKVTRLRSADDRAAAIQLGESKHVMLSYQVGHARHAS